MVTDAENSQHQHRDSVHPNPLHDIRADGMQKKQHPSPASPTLKYSTVAQGILKAAREKPGSKRSKHSAWWLEVEVVVHGSSMHPGERWSLPDLCNAR